MCKQGVLFIKILRCGLHGPNIFNSRAGLELSIQKFGSFYHRNLSYNAAKYTYAFKHCTKHSSYFGSRIDNSISKSLDNEYSTLNYTVIDPAKNLKGVFYKKHSNHQIHFTPLCRKSNTALCSLDRNVKSHCTIRNFSTIKEQVVNQSAFNNLADLGFVEKFLKSMYESVPVEFTQRSLISFHEFTGLPWWTTFVVASVTLRTFMIFPLQIYQHHIMVRLANIRHEIENIQRKILEKTKSSAIVEGWSNFRAKAMFRTAMSEEWNKLVVRDNCHPLKTIIVSLVQIPMLLMVFFSIKNICFLYPPGNESVRQAFLELTTGGFGWIQNLAAADQTFILPVLLTIMNLSAIEVMHMMAVQDPTRLQKFVLYGCRVACGGILIISCYLPSGIVLYWLSNSTVGLAYHLLLATPKFRRIVRIPKTDTEIKYPYTFLKEKAKKRLGLPNHLD
ncbi:mitochondrial inner membrane protein COX18 [Orussus abietinus]|uniref:mitochondrial inner membrane protein COX18 n=1 Tax=Orussus abietinus TaxID=222816 RepID=UPI0006267B30|nr:mitochondrial inner membrane protein COX18 [Orussus abietinus]XP_012286659.1 mitochondrial inner membrane protein COX18 [Orussus abietinus]